MQPDQNPGKTATEAEVLNPRDTRETERPRSGYLAQRALAAGLNPDDELDSGIHALGVGYGLVRPVQGTDLAPNPGLLRQLTATAQVPAGYALDATALELGVIRVIPSGTEAPKMLEVINDPGLHAKAIAEAKAREVDLMRMAAEDYDQVPQEVKVQVYEDREFAHHQDRVEAYAKGQAAMLKSIDAIPVRSLVWARMRRWWDGHVRVLWSTAPRDEHEELAE